MENRGIQNGQSEIYLLRILNSFVSNEKLELGGLFDEKFSQEGLSDGELEIEGSSDKRSSMLWDQYFQELQQQTTKDDDSVHSQMNRARRDALLTEIAKLDGYNEVHHDTGANGYNKWDDMGVLNDHRRLQNRIHKHDGLEHVQFGIIAEELEGLHQDGSMSGFQYEFLNQFWFENGIYECIRFQQGVSVEELQQPELSDENPQQVELSHPSPQQVGLSNAELQQGGLLNEELEQTGFVSDEELEQEGLPNEEFHQEELSTGDLEQVASSNEELEPEGILDEELEQERSSDEEFEQERSSAEELERKRSLDLLYRGRSSILWDQYFQELRQQTTEDDDSVHSQMNRARLDVLLTEIAELDGYNEVHIDTGANGCNEWDDTGVLNNHRGLQNRIHKHDGLGHVRFGIFAEELEGLHQEESMSGF